VRRFLDDNPTYLEERRTKFGDQANHIARTTQEAARLLRESLKKFPCCQPPPNERATSSHRTTPLKKGSKAHKKSQRKAERDREVLSARYSVPGHLKTFIDGALALAKHQPSPLPALLRSKLTGLIGRVLRRDKEFDENPQMCILLQKALKDVPFLSTRPNLHWDIQRDIYRQLSREVRQHEKEHPAFARIYVQARCIAYLLGTGSPTSGIT